MFLCFCYFSLFVSCRREGGRGEVRRGVVGSQYIASLPPFHFYSYLSFEAMNHQTLQPVFFTRAGITIKLKKHIYFNYVLRLSLTSNLHSYIPYTLICLLFAPIISLYHYTIIFATYALCFAYLSALFYFFVVCKLFIAFNITFLFVSALRSFVRPTVN